MSVIPVAAAVIAHDGRILGALRRDGLEGAGWEFPGGKVREGETSEQACRREVAEELGCELGTMWSLDTFSHQVGADTLSMEVFVAELLPGEQPTASEHKELRWLAQEDLLSVAWLPIDSQVVQTLGYYWNEIFSPMHS